MKRGYLFVLLLVFAGCSQQQLNEKISSGPSLLNRLPPPFYTQGSLEIPSLINDRYYSSTGAWSNVYADLWGHIDLEAESLYPRLALPAREIVVAVIDTGVDFDHEDLKGRLWVNPIESDRSRYNNGVDDDRNGFKDDFLGWDWVNDSNNPADDHGHGTHVAATIAAIGGNGIGIVGVAPWVRIMALKVCNYQGSCNTNDIRDAMSYAVRNGANVINLSLGGPDDGPEGQAFEAAIASAEASGVVVVTSAGNDANDVGEYSPANATYATVAAAHRSDGHICGFSNYGWKLDVSGPGCGEKLGLDSSGILSANSQKCGTLGNQSCSSRNLVDGRYTLKSGTSMSAPHISGLAALYLTVQPSATPLEVRQAIAKSARANVAGSKNIDFGYGQGDARDLWKWADTVPGLKITSPFYGTTSANHVIKFRIEAQNNPVNWQLRSIDITGSFASDIALNGGVLIDRGIVAQNTSSNLSDNYAPARAGTYLLVLSGEIGGEMFYDTSVVKR